MDISVIIVTKNRYPLLQKAVDSVYLQSYPVSELIIVNDASSDETVAYLDSLTGIRVVHNETSIGGAAARNVGIAKASGDYIAFLDDDDQWDSLKIERQVSEIEKSRADIIYTGTTVINEEGKKGAHCFHEGMLHPRLAICFLNYIGITSTVMIRRSILCDDTFDIQMPALQEYELFIRLIRNGATVRGVPEYLVSYLQVRDEHTISSGFRKNLTASKRILQKHGKGVYWLFHLLGLFRIFLQKCYRSKRFREDFFCWIKGNDSVS